MGNGHGLGVALQELPLHGPHAANRLGRDVVHLLRVAVIVEASRQDDAAAGHGLDVDDARQHTGFVQVGGGDHGQRQKERRADENDGLGQILGVQKFDRPREP